MLPNPMPFFQDLKDPRQRSTSRDEKQVAQAERYFNDRH